MGLFCLSFFFTDFLGSHEEAINIGFVSTEPVPFRDSCLFPQEVYGTDTIIYAGAAVEPTLAVNPKHHHHIVAAWQQGRIDNGGALECGIAFSKDGGKKWRRTLVPFQKCLGGIIQRISDVWLSYSKDGSRVYLLVLLLNANDDPDVTAQSGVAVSISYDDGERWTDPTVIFSSDYYFNETTATSPVADKTAITADRNNTYYAYSVWDVFDNASSSHSSTFLSITRTGGNTWTAPAVLYDPFLDPSLDSNGVEEDCSTTDNVIVVLPKIDFDDRRWREDSWGSEENKAKRFSGDILNFMTRIYASPEATSPQYSTDTWPYQFTEFDIAVTRSHDKGTHWNQTATQINSLGMDDPEVFTKGYSYTDGKVTGGVGYLLRTGSIVPSFNVNPENGFLYVVYQTGQFRGDSLPVIALQTSRDGGYTWSRPVIVSRTPSTSPNPQAFTPFVAVDNKGRVGILYYDTRKDSLTVNTNTPTNAWLAIYKEVRQPNGGSTGIGLDFVKEVRLTNRSFNAQNGPLTPQGIMSVGDYIFLDAKGDDFYAIFTATTKGPYNPPETILIDNDNYATVALDENPRQFPYFIKIDDD